MVVWHPQIKIPDTDIFALMHLVPNPFDPRTSRPHFLSPWTNDTHKIDPPGQGPHQIRSPLTNGPQKFGPPGQMVPKQFGHHIYGNPQPYPLNKQNTLRTICPGGPNWLGTICLGGPNFLGPFAHAATELVTDQLLGTKCSGTICGWDQMCHSQHFRTCSLACICMGTMGVKQPQNE